MPFHNAGSIKYFTFEKLTDKAISHAVFTRLGGISPAPWDSLNVGGFIGDDLERTYINRVRSFEVLNRDPESVYDVWQVHSADVICTDTPRPKDVSHKKADAILTNNPDVTLFMRFADCVPILLFDPNKKVVGLAHAGWQGTVKKIAEATVKKMIAVYQSDPKDIRAGIGPSIGPHHYEVGPDVIEQVIKAFDFNAANLLTSINGSTHFDLWAANRLLLERVGLDMIEISELCTACHTDDWFSHRGEKGKTGRFGALIALNG
jgi:YfiH family protein